MKIILDEPELEVVVINDLMTIDNAAYLFKYDSVYGRGQK
ncbi:MAG: glyceraldehyde 3-phosphate dehydrogenase NAD-binding domain-containing protein [Puia sp.]